MSHANTPGGKMSVMLIDGSVSFRSRLRSYLQTCLPLVEIVAETGDGKEAVMLVETVRPDVVILDIQLGAHGGIQLLSQIRARPRPPVMIVLTHLVAREYHLACLEEGADFFFDKMFDLEILKEVLRSLRLRPADDLFTERARV